MVRRYYRSCITLQFALPMTGCAVLVFIFAFFTFRTGSRILYGCGTASGIALIAVLLLVQLRKYQVSAQLKGIRRIDEYFGSGAMIGRSFILEERMLICDDRLKITEHAVSPYMEMKVTAKQKERQEITLQTASGTFSFTADNLLQAERLAAFLQKRNPSIRLEGITPDGSGSLKELGAA